MTCSGFDVAIIGGGPGGSATALSLLSHDPSVSVVLIDASIHDRIGIGETLPPPARALLEHLKVWDAFLAQDHRPVFGTTSSWGARATFENDYIFMTANTGWLLDRATFDQMLLGEAGKRGAALFLDTRMRSARRDEERWRLALANGETVSARFVVDATGGAASFARGQGASFVESDSLIGIARFFEDDGEDARIMVEAFERGWWYTASFARKRVVACMTDADLARRSRFTDADRWHDALLETIHVSSLVQRDKPAGSFVIRSTASRRLDMPAAEDWLAVGDAASRFDPLSSQGITKALRSGIFASYAISDLLSKGDTAGLERYRRYVRNEFQNYIEVRRKYYREEKRWPGSEFWRRRHEPENAGALVRSQRAAQSA